MCCEEPDGSRDEEPRQPSSRGCLGPVTRVRRAKRLAARCPRPHIQRRWGRCRFVPWCSRYSWGARCAHEVADELRALGLADGVFAVAEEVLGRLVSARLVRARTGGHGGALFMITARGRRELALQRLVVSRLARAGLVAPKSPL